MSVQLLIMRYLQMDGWIKWMDGSNGWMDQMDGQIQPSIHQSDGWIDQMDGSDGWAWMDEQVNKSYQKDIKKFAYVKN